MECLGYDLVAGSTPHQEPLVFRYHCLFLSVCWAPKHFIPDGVPRMKFISPPPPQLVATLSHPWISLHCSYVACLLATVPLFVKSWAYWLKWWEIYFIRERKIHPCISWWMHNTRHLQYKSSCLSDKFTAKTVKLEHKVVDLSRRQDLALSLEMLSVACKWCWSPAP